MIAWMPMAAISRWFMAVESVTTRRWSSRALQRFVSIRTANIMSRRWPWKDFYSYNGVYSDSIEEVLDTLSGFHVRAGVWRY